MIYIITLFFILTLPFVINHFIKVNRIDFAMKKTGSQIILLILFVAFVFVLLVLIYYVLSPTLDNDKLFKLFGVFSQALNVDPKLNMDRNIYDLIVSIAGAVCFGGILISTISNIIQRRVDSYTKGEVRYSHLHGHNIIIGANELLEPAMRHLMLEKKGKHNKMVKKRIERITLVLTTEDAEKTRARIRKMGVIDDNNLIIYRDNIFNWTHVKRKKWHFSWLHSHNNSETSSNSSNLNLAKEKYNVLKQLNLSKCKQVVVIGDEPIENSDINNTNIADLIYRSSFQMKKRKRPLPIYVSYYDDAYFMCFFNKDLGVSHVYFYPFNYYELCIANVWGYKLLYEKNNYPGLSNISEKKPLHLYILGFNVMGQEVLKAALKWAHFSNCAIKQTKISIFTENQEAQNRFLRRYPNINGKVFDMDIDYTIQSPYAKETMDILEEAVCNEEERPYIVICSGNSTNNFMLATHLPAEVYRKGVPILVQFDHNSYTLQQRFHTNNKRFDNIHFFGFHNNDIPFSLGLEIAQELYSLHVKNKDNGVPQDTESNKWSFHNYLKKAFSNEQNKNDNNDARTQWEAKPYNNVRRTHISCAHGLSVLLQELGLSVVENPDKKSNKENPGRDALLGDITKDILQRIYVGSYLAAGNIPTNSPYSENDEDNGCLNELFTYDELKKAGGESFLKRDKRLKEYIEEILEWLTKNGKTLKETSSLKQSERKMF